MNEIRNGIGVEVRDVFFFFFFFFFFFEEALIVFCTSHCL